MKRSLLQIQVLGTFAAVFRSIILLGVLAACGSSMAPGADDTVDVPVGDSPLPPDTGTCGLRAGQRGYTTHNATVAGIERTYHVYLPERASATTPIPLVMVFHGYTMSGDKMHDITDYTEIADAEGIALAFPDGQGGADTLGAPWNVGSNVCPTFAGIPPNATGDDFALLDHIKAEISEDQCLDTDHLYATGFSMGGYFSHHIGCMRSDFRAVAPASGGTHDLENCTNDRRPIIIFHGSADPLVPAGCNDPGALPVIATEPAADAWATKNGCSLTTTPRAVTGGTCFHYEGCPADGQVELCTFDNMGHCWAGGNASAGIYSCPEKASATQLEWDFFKQYAF
jgi:polyhydroxybutyrate depolymerase